MLLSGTGRVVSRGAGSSSPLCHGSRRQTRTLPRHLVRPPPPLGSCTCQRCSAAFPRPHQPQQAQTPSSTISATKCGSAQEETVEYLTGYVDGEYRVLVKEPNTAGGVCPRFLCTDCSLEVDARYAANNYYACGLTFGITHDDESGYFFLVYEEGYYAIWDMIGGQFETIIDYTASEHVRCGQSTNHLRVARVGQEIRTFISGHHIITVSDDTIMGSLRVGLVAGASNLPNVDVRFNNFYAAPYASGSE